MKGRDFFYFYNWLIIILSVLVGVTPKWFRLMLWSFLDLGRGKISLGIRYVLLKSLVVQCGDVVFIGSGVEICKHENIRIGNNVSVHRGCYLDAHGGIEIGNDVSIAHQTSLISSEHSWEDKNIPIRENPIHKGKIIIEGDVWIGCGVRILSGVKIGRRCVVAAGAVVNRDLPGGALYAGVPARKIKEL